MLEVEKTTTLIKLAQENSEKKILYLAFNKAIVEEIKIKRKNAPNINPYTFDALMRKCLLHYTPDIEVNYVDLKPITFADKYPWFNKKPWKLKQSFITKYNAFCKDIKHDKMKKFY